MRHLVVAAMVGICGCQLLVDVVLDDRVSGDAAPDADGGADAPGSEASAIDANRDSTMETDATVAADAFVADASSDAPTTEVIVATLPCSDNNSRFCTLPQRCCWKTGSSGACTAGLCNSDESAFECARSADCTNGNVCCGTTVAGGAGVPTRTRTSCEIACASNEVMCQNGADCKGNNCVMAIDVIPTPYRGACP